MASPACQPQQVLVSFMEAEKKVTYSTRRHDGSTNFACYPSGAYESEHTNRTLILCFDGTADQFDADNSNIVQRVSLLKKGDRTSQLVYYQAGISTYTSPNIATPFMSQVRQKLDEMFAWNLHAHVTSGYEFLMPTYITGDKICIFGFSRGAYTARSLAGMLHKIGLLPAGNYQQVPFAYKMYTRADHVGWEQSNELKRRFLWMFRSSLSVCGCPSRPQTPLSTPSAMPSHWTSALPSSKPTYGTDRTLRK